MAKISLDPDQLSVTSFEPVRPPKAAVAADTGQGYTCRGMESCYFECINYETIYSCNVFWPTNCC